jgi:hypothetical protein
MRFKDFYQLKGKFPIDYLLQLHMAGSFCLSIPVDDEIQDSVSAD